MPEGEDKYGWANISDKFDKDGECKWLGLEYRIGQDRIMTIISKRWVWPFTDLIKLILRIRYNFERRKK